MNLVLLIFEKGNSLLIEYYWLPIRTNCFFKYISFVKISYLNYSIFQERFWEISIQREPSNSIDAVSSAYRYIKYSISYMYSGNAIPYMSLLLFIPQANKFGRYKGIISVCLCNRLRAITIV